MATYHILNGDCLEDQLRQTKVNQNFIVCRECLIEGDLDAASLEDFWKIRANFITVTYGVSAEDYFSKTVSEFGKLYNLPAGSEICLWFENDLFCQANMWFMLALLSERLNPKVYRVFPVIDNKTDRWKGFGISTTEKLEQAYSSKVQFKPEDVELGKQLWEAYRKGNFKKLQELSRKQSDCFEYLEEVCRAHIERYLPDKNFGRPEKIIKEIIRTKSKGFQEVYSEFSAREGIYGFGDLQVKNIYDRQMQAP